MTTSLKKMCFVQKNVLWKWSVAGAMMLHYDGQGSTGDLCFVTCLLTDGVVFRGDIGSMSQLFDLLH